MVKPADGVDVVDGLLDVQAGGALHQLEYRHIGAHARADAPVLVFLHEGLGCVRGWRRFPQTLCAATGLAGFVYSRAGYGGSSPAQLPREPRYLHDEALTVLPAVLDAAGIRRAVLVGHSDGASIALIFAGSRHAQGRLDALVCMAPHVFNEPACVDGVREADAAWRTGTLAQGLARYHGEQTEATFTGWRDIWLHKRFRRWNIEACLESIDVPVLLLQGVDDAYGTPAQLDAIEQGVRTVVRPPLIESCGHSPHVEQPDTARAAIARFVTDQLAASAARTSRTSAGPR